MLRVGLRLMRLKGSRNDKLLLWEVLARPTNIHATAKTFIRFVCSLFSCPRPLSCFCLLSSDTQIMHSSPSRSRKPKTHPCKIRNKKAKTHTSRSRSNPQNSKQNRCASQTKTHSNRSRFEDLEATRSSSTGCWANPNDTCKFQWTSLLEWHLQISANKFTNFSLELYCEVNSRERGERCRVRRKRGWEERKGGEGRRWETKSCGFNNNKNINNVN